MSTAIALSTAANANAAMAADAARRAEEAACSILVRGYQHNNANMQQMQAYAQCVETLYPSHRLLESPDGVIFAKALILAALAGMLIGAFVGLKESFGEILGVFVYAFCGLILGPIAIIVLCGIWLGIRFLLNI